MKKLFFAAAAVFAFGITNAQEGGFKAGVNVGLPIGDAGDAFSFTYGLDAAYMFPISDEFTAGVTTGYQFFSGKSIDLGEFGSIKLNAAFIPIAASAQYSVSETFFLGADLGYALYSGDGNGEGGVYYQPKVGYQAEKYEIYAGYKGVAVENGSIASVNLGFNYKF